MHRLELLILLVVVLGLVIWFIKSKRFDRFLDWFLGSAPVNAEQIGSRAATLKNERDALLELAKERQKTLEQEHEKLENFNSKKE